MASAFRYLAQPKLESTSVAKPNPEDAPSARAISFIVPAYNEEAELPGTLDSIHSAAASVECDYEIVLVDDGSSDATASIGEKFGAQVTSINCRQIAAARNAGARAAGGDIFVFIDADTRITSSHVSGAIGALASGDVGGGSRLRVDDEIPRWGRILFRAFTTVYFALQLGAGAFLFTTRANFFVVGGFDETYFAGEEILFTFALKKLGRFKILPEPAITSGRKLRLYSGAKILRHALALLCGGRRAVRSRHKLAIWYGGERERHLG
jgi:glycosyltransferase involved in cell wall biosynthesis